jgi:hypothetical protein
MVREAMREIEKVTERFTDGHSLVDYALVYQDWFPEKDFNLDNFKKIPKDIIDLTVASIVVAIFKTYFNKDFGSKSEKAITAAAYQAILQAILFRFKLDIVFIEETLKARGFTDREIEEAKRFFI